MFLHNLPQMENFFPRAGFLITSFWYEKRQESLVEKHAIRVQWSEMIENLLSGKSLEWENVFLSSADEICMTGFPDAGKWNFNGDVFSCYAGCLHVAP